MIRDLGPPPSSNIVSFSVDNNGKILGWGNPDPGKPENHVYLYTGSSFADLGITPEDDPRFEGRFDNAATMNYQVLPTGEVIDRVIHVEGTVDDYVARGGRFLDIMKEVDDLGPFKDLLSQVPDLATADLNGSQISIRHNGTWTRFELSKTPVRVLSVGVNSDGAIFGTAYVMNNGYREDFPFILDGSILRDLNSLIPQDEGWILGAMVGVADRGQIVVEGAHSPGGFGALLTPTGAPFPKEAGATDIRLQEIGDVGSSGPAVFRARRHHHRHRAHSETSGKKGSVPGGGVKLPWPFYRFAS